MPRLFLKQTLQKRSRPRTIPNESRFIDLFANHAVCGFHDQPGFCAKIKPRREAE